MRKTSELIDELRITIKKSIEENGYEETRKIYIRNKKKKDWICFLLIVLSAPLCIALELPTFGAMLAVILLPYLLLHDYDAEFDRLLEEYPDK